MNTIFVFSVFIFTRNEQREYTKEEIHWKVVSVVEICK